jgi:signal transduction histidine kinase
MPKWRSSSAYRIAFSALGVLLLGLAVLGSVVFGATHVAFRRQLDATISEESRTLVDEYHSDGEDELRQAIADREASKSPQRLMYAVFLPNGQRIYGSLVTGRPPVGMHDIQFVDPKDGPDEGRALAVDLSPERRLLVAADREWIERIDHTLLALFGAAFVAASLLGLAGAMTLASYLERRLRSISDSAEAIIAGDTGKRMPVSARRDEFDQLASTLNRMLDRIEGLLENLRQVSNDIAHDLRTPLARLRNKLEQAQGERAQVVIEDALRQVDDVLSLFSAILRLAEVESGETRRFFSPVDVSALATELAESFVPTFEDDGRQFLWSIESGLTVEGDRELIAQTIVNLLENAERHTPQQTLVRFTATAVGSSVCLQVVDSGPGIARRDRARVVKRFARLDSSRNTAGHGLGLSLVSAVATLHGGRLILKDAGPGLIAIVDLPKIKASPATAKPSTDGA